MRGYFITGTDTDAGKTVAAAWAMLHLDGAYWKPVQSGPPADAQTVCALTGFEAGRFFPSTYTFSQPLSPHEAARRDGVRIDMEKFVLPACPRPLIVEGAGGVMVPLTDTGFMIDLMARLRLPVILVCRSGLGTINHSLLSLAALRSRSIPVAGLVLNGPKTAHNRRALEDYGGVRVLAEIDWQETLSREALLCVQPEADLRNFSEAAA